MASFSHFTSSHRRVQRRQRVLGVVILFSFIALASLAIVRLPSTALQVHPALLPFRLEDKQRIQDQFTPIHATNSRTHDITHDDEYNVSSNNDDNDNERNHNASSSDSSSHHGLYHDTVVHDVAATVEITTQQAKKFERVPTRRTPDRPYTYFDAGSGVYHESNNECPVPWEWVTIRDNPDVIFYDVLGGHPFYRIINREIPGIHRDFPEQLVVFNSGESGVYYPFIYDVKDMGANYSMDYRIWPDHPHGPSDIPTVYLPNPNSPNFDLNLRAPPRMPKRNDALIAAFISNCFARNDRSKYLEAFKQAEILHAYGACMKNVDEPPPQTEPGAIPKSRRQSKIDLASQYFFLFTPENSDDMSYVTEKVYDAFSAGVIPVYMGAPDIERFIPHPSSIIRATDFESPHHLIQYLKELAEDEEKYLKYFEWKNMEFSDAFKRVLRLASRTPHCRLAMQLEGIDPYHDLQDLEFFPLSAN